MERILIVDGHCDTLTALKPQKRRLGDLASLGQADLIRWRAGGVKLQIMAICGADCFPGWETLGTLQCLGQFYRELEQNSLHWLKWQEDWAVWQKSEQMGILLVLEGGEALGGKVELVEVFFNLGIRMIGLTWNYRNQLADGVQENGGLTRLGRQVVQEMNRLGMLVDAAHLAPKGMADLEGMAQKPWVVSHANCQRLCPNPRNLADWQIKACAEQGGVIGVCFYPPFLTGTEQASVEDVLNHIEYLATMGGIECVGLGSDFDGMELVPQGLEDASKISILGESLQKRGFSQAEIELIMGRNWLRVLTLPEKPKG